MKALSFCCLFLLVLGGCAVSLGGEEVARHTGPDGFSCMSYETIGAAAREKPGEPHEWDTTKGSCTIEDDGEWRIVEVRLGLEKR